METPGTQLKTPPPGFKEIAESLMGDYPSRTTANIPPVLVSPGLLAGSAVATMMSMEICQDEMTGNIYMSTVTASMGLINLETPLMAVDCEMLTLEDVTDTETVDINPK